jgi:Beta propeller domain
MISHTRFTLRAWALAWSTVAGLAACGGGSEGGSGGNGPTGTAELVPARSGDVVAYVKARSGAWSSSGAPTDAVAVPVSAGTGSSGSSESNSVAPAATSGTQVQERGVDEDDLLKAEGNRLYSLQRSTGYQPGKPWARLQMHQREPDGSLTAGASLDVPPQADAWGTARGIYLLPGTARAAVLSESAGFMGGGSCPADAVCAALAIAPGDGQPAAVWVDLLDTATPSAPRWSQRLRFEGSLVDSRRIGNALVLVTHYQPPFVAQALPLDAPARASLVSSLGAADVLPHFTRASGATEPLVAERDCYVQSGNASNDVGITTVSVIDLSAANPSPRSRCVLGGTEAIYMSPGNLYLATTRWAYNATTYASSTTTDLHKFAISLDTTDYRGSAEVPGHLGWDPQMKSYRLSEHQGDLRVLTYTGDTGWALPMPMEAGSTAAATRTPPDSPATLHILRESASEKRLQRVGQLPNAQRPAALGKPGEQVYGVRFVGDRGYVVTFRRTDPLYVLDLADPTDPKALGALEAAGFSNVLFPVGEGLLLGVGKDANASGQVGGVKVGLFDVADGAHPRELAAQTFGGPGSASGLDVSRHGIDLATQGDTVRVALPMALWLGGSTAGGQGLQRLEVNTRARTLTTRGLIASPAAGTTYDLSQERSVQVDDQVYYLSGGQLGAWAW